jgi:hypothetical protein
MRSEARVRLALDAVAGPARAFRAALAESVEEVRSYLSTYHSSWESRVAAAAAELGPLASGRIDPARFAALFLEPGAVDATTVTAIKRAMETLAYLAHRGDDLLHVSVPTGGSLYAVVSEAIAEIGRGFAGARAVAHLRAAGPGNAERAPETSASLGPLPFSRWNRNERRLAPPLVVDIDGGDLRAAALAEFMDGRQRILLVVEGECPPAPLARLIAPGTFVLQTHDGSGLDRLAAWQGPGIAALVPDCAVQFVHDPAAGAASWERLQILSVPERPPRRPVAGLSVAQQVEEMDLLQSLVARPAAVAAAASPAGAAAAAADPADRLATWLLSQVDLSDPR